MAFHFVFCTRIKMVVSATQDLSGPSPYRILQPDPNKTKWSLLFTETRSVICYIREPQVAALDAVYSRIPVLCPTTTLPFPSALARSNAINERGVHVGSSGELGFRGLINQHPPGNAPLRWSALFPQKLQSYYRAHSGIADHNLLHN